MKEELELRMYFFVMCNISPIQQGIQAGHAVEQYAYVHCDDQTYRNFVEAHKTWIILNGGPSNNNYAPEDPGHLGNIEYTLTDIGANFATFNEPDLNNALSAVCFLASQPVFDYTQYPDLDKFAKTQFYKYEISKWAQIFRNGQWSYDLIKTAYPKLYKSWSKMMGGEENIRLRELLKGKNLA